MMDSKAPLRVVVVDDSALIRSLLSAIINAAPDMQVVATAADPLIAREKIRETNPDVVTLDVEMPHMDGLEFLRRMMRLRPTPVLMISALTQAGSETAFKALELGAVDFWGKPSVDIARVMESYSDEIRDKIRSVAAARLCTPWPARASSVPMPYRANARPLRQDALVCIGASTGGPEALRIVLCALPANMPPVLVVQHMPEGFTQAFAERLDYLCELKVKEAEHGEPVQPGVVYIAPGHSHLRVHNGGLGLRVALDQDGPVNQHRPSVDVLFDSVAELPGAASVGVILTGMGRDGAAGMRRLKDAGGYNLAQDESSSVVYGMPREALLSGGVDEVLPLEQIAPALLARLQQR